MGLNEFLLYAATGVGASALLSFITERWPLFQTWSPEARAYFSLIGSVLIALGAWAVLTYVPPDTLEQLRTPFQIVAGVVVAWLGNQFAHANDPAAERKVQPVTPAIPSKTAELTDELSTLHHL